MTQTFTLENKRDGSWLKTYAFAMAGITFFLMALGSATRVMNAGLSCPDWPLCYGEVVPVAKMNLQVFLEWFHRLVASSLGVLTLGFAAAVFWYRQSLPRWVLWSGPIVVAMVIFQGILGGLTVTELLRFDIVTAHLATGMLFWATWITIALCFPTKTTENTTFSTFLGADRLAKTAGIAAILVYGQSILGALVASQWALHQCMTNASLCAVMNNHILGVIPASLATLSLPLVLWRTPEVPLPLQRHVWITIALLILQIGLGIATYRLELQIEVLTVLHQSVAAALFGLLLALALRSGQSSAKVTPTL